MLITPRELTYEQVTMEAIELRFFVIRRLSLEVKDFFYQSYITKDDKLEFFLMV